MGTDRHQMFSGPCPCGKGTLQVDHCEKDHPWVEPGEYWYEGAVHCDICGPKYELRKVGRSFGLFDRGIAERNDARSREAWERRSKVLAGDKAQGYFKKLAAVLDEQPSHAATHRLLDGAGFYVPNIAKFRKTWRGGEHWVRGDRPDMAKVLKVLKVKDDALLAEIAAAEKHEAEPDKMVGAAVYTLPKDA